MPVGFWAPNRSSGNGGTRRRRRNLLAGRKNRSDNDLPQQSLNQPQQQHQQHLMQQGKESTTLVLPENVRTILIAGTPECWNLSTSADDFVPEDASLLTYGSELSPGSLTIDEDEPYRGSSPRQRSPKQQKDGLEWLRRPGARNSTTAKITKRRQQGPVKEPSSMVVMYRSPKISPGSPQEAIQLWLNSVEVLMRSKEMSALVTSTRDVVHMAGGLAVKTAFLPVTLPLHMACATKDFIGWTVHQALSGNILQLTNGDEQEAVHKRADTKPNEKEQASNPLEGLLQLVPVVLQSAGKVKDEIGSAVIGLVTPPQPKDATRDTCKDKEVLDRLKIPVVNAEGKIEEFAEVVAPTKTPTHRMSASKADFSKFLLQVEDLDVSAPDSKATILYVDLSSEFREDALMKSCLDKLAAQGLALATCHAPAIPPATPSENGHVEWKPEGVTAKLLRKKERQTTERWDETIQSEVLIWSGNFKKAFGGSPINRQFPMFLARGIIGRMAPRDFLELLWDNNRTAEYNNFCMGREDVIQIDDNVLSSRNVHTGVKVVRSETRVPFTGLSVSLCTMMHCRALPGGPQEGYIIASRSLVSGMAGSHTASCRSIQKSKSEILWGVNVLRSVPGHPGQTELTSVSQVASSMVPKFLSQRIGIMGVEDFFKSIRSTPKVAISSPTSPTSTSPASSFNTEDSCVSV